MTRLKGYATALGWWVGVLRRTGRDRARLVEITAVLRSPPAALSDGIELQGERGCGEKIKRSESK